MNEKQTMPLIKNNKQKPRRFKITNKRRKTYFLMKHRMRGQKGFTLVEMMIVLLVITVLLIITIPNITKHNSNINNKGCNAFIKMVQAQVQAYELDQRKLPTSISDLETSGYLKKDETTCPNGTKIKLGADGEVSADL